MTTPFCILLFEKKILLFFQTKKSANHTAYNDTDQCLTHSLGFWAIEIRFEQGQLDADENVTIFKQ